MSGHPDPRLNDLARTLHVTRSRVAMADSDHAGLIYYSRPLEWQEALTGQWLASIGRPVSSLIGAGFAFPVATATATYHRATGLDDDLRIELRALRVGTTSFDLGTVCSNDRSETCIELVVTHVWSVIAHAAGENALPRPSPVPDWLREALIGSDDGSPHGR